MDPAHIVADHLIWGSIYAEYAEATANESLLAGFLSHAVLSQPDLETALAYILAAKLDNATLPTLGLHDITLDVPCNEECIQNVIRADLQAAVQRDSATTGYANPLFYFEGFHSIRAHRVAHSYWGRDRHTLTLYLQSWISEVFAVDIYPAARIGKGIMFDHATSIVIGETTVVGDNFSMLYEVALGGSDREGDDRHPKIGHGVMIGAGAKILGNIRIEEGAKINAGSMVLKDIPPYATVAGVPTKVVSIPSTALPILDVDQFPPSAQ